MGGLGEGGGVDRLWVGTSWKMTKTIPEALAYMAEVSQAAVPPGVQVFVIPPHTALAAVRAALDPASPIALGAQNAHWAAEGAATGEVSMRMVRDAGAELVELGHSERRESFCEDDERVARKVRSALDAGLTPLVCVGEPHEVRRAGGAAEFIEAQVRMSLSRVDGAEVGRVLFAYEPVWAIGERGRPATLDEVVPVVLRLRHNLAELAADGRAAAVLYGGSVTEANVAELVTAPGVDGVFVGRAAWSAAGLMRLIELAAEARSLLAAEHG